jgi:hypothetical protein
MKIPEFLSSRLKSLFPPPSVIRARPLSDAQLLEALAVDPDQPLFQAVLEVIDRAKNESRTNARAVIKRDRETVFALGAEEGLDRLQDYLLNLRAEAMRQRQQG